MDGGENERSGRQARVPAERDVVVAPVIEQPYCGGRYERKIGDNTHVHNNGLAEDKSISNVLDHFIFLDLIIRL